MVTERFVKTNHIPAISNGVQVLDDGLVIREELQVENLSGGYSNLFTDGISALSASDYLTL